MKFLKEMLVKNKYTKMCLKYIYTFKIEKIMIKMHYTQMSSFQG